METYQLRKALESIYPEGVVFPRPRVASARLPWAVEYNPFGVNAINLVRFNLPLA